MALWDGNESSCPCDCGFDIPKGGTLETLTLVNALDVSSGGTGANTPTDARKNLGIYSGKSGSTKLSASNPSTVNISFGQTFSVAPNVVVSPQCSDAAGGAYGIFSYVMSVSATGCAVRLTTNYEGDLTVYVQWLAVGTPTA